MCIPLQQYLHGQHQGVPYQFRVQIDFMVGLSIVASLAAFSLDFFPVSLCAADLIWMRYWI